MGAGHDTVAAELARRAREQGHEAEVLDVLELLPYHLGTGLRGFYQSSVRHYPWAYAGLYRLFLRRGSGSRPSGVPLARLAGDRLAERVARFRPDVVVPVFHLAAQLTGHLRSRGALKVPSAVYVVDFAVHRQWLHPGNDLYLCLTDEATGEVREDIRRPAVTTGPCVSPDFAADSPGGSRGADAWRQLFERYGPGRTPVVLSCGAWGAATGLAATAGLLTGRGCLPVVVCGRNDRLRQALSDVPGVLAPGWVSDMPGLLHAARALVDNAAGQTAVQSLAAGLPVVGYRPIPGHGEEGVRRMAALGLTEVAGDERALCEALDRLTADGEARRSRIEHGRTLFRDEDPLARLLALTERVRAG
ncbi:MULTISPECIES: MGDG synthase family glycosyltransferase [unclassified Streptomyces]|uniref:MGDG synthase family glycosyltransferase n=1 Tax=unclassified Streptomyces TaxID=2593676 RepID=UPI0005245EF4|nr:MULTISPECIES: galactosyldiacylglycerol synthase [unclassified Streptomyces]